MADIIVDNQTSDLIVLKPSAYENKAEPLVKGKPFKLVGTFTPKDVGKYKFTATLTFDGGAATPVSTNQSEAIAVDVVGTLDEGFPEEMVFRDEKAVSFTFTNSTALPVAVTALEKVEVKDKGTLVNLTYAIIKLAGNTEVKKGAALDQFKNEKAILAGHKVVVTGQYKAPAVATDVKDGEVGLKLSYGTDKAVAAWVKTKVIALVITPSASDLPNPMEVDQPQEVTFTFANNTSYEAKNVKITITREPSEGG